MVPPWGRQVLATALGATGGEAGLPEGHPPLLGRGGSSAAVGVAELSVLSDLQGGGVARRQAVAL